MMSSLASQECNHNQLLHSAKSSQNYLPKIRVLHQTAKPNPFTNNLMKSAVRYNTHAKKVTDVQKSESESIKMRSERFNPENLETESGMILNASNVDITESSMKLVKHVYQTT